MKYVIQPGDTLSELAKKFDVPQVELMRVNGIVNPDKIYAGHILEIPSAPFALVPGFTPLRNWIKKLIGEP